MKILVLDNPADHGIEIYPFLKPTLRLMGVESGLAKNVSQADSMLESGEFGLLLFHHSTFREVDYIKQRHPQVLTAIYSAELTIESFQGSIPQAFREKAKEHYDIVLNGLDSATLAKKIREIK